MLQFFASPNFWFSVLASTTPVLLATLAANIMTKSGLFNLGIEGTMLMCALAGVLGSAFTGSLFLGAVIGMALGILVSFILGYFILKMNAPMNACGVAINLAATGGTVFILVMVCGSKNNSTSLVSGSFPNIALPIIEDIPVLGQILSGQNFVTYLSWFFVAATYFILYHTKLGLNIRAVGENEEAARSAGINVMAMKFISLAMCGIFCAFGVYFGHFFPNQKLDVIAVNVFVCYLEIHIDRIFQRQVCRCDFEACRFICCENGRRANTQNQNKDKC